MLIDYLAILADSRCEKFCILGAKVTIIASKTKGNHAKLELKGNYSIILNKTKRDDE